VELTSPQPSLTQPLLARAVMLNRLGEQEARPKKYETAVTFRILNKDISRLQEITLAIVDAGVTQLNEPCFQTSRLKEFRPEARRAAMAYPREKTTLYCEVAGRGLGQLIHLEDVHPEGGRFANAGSITRSSTDLEASDDASSVGILRFRRRYRPSTASQKCAHAVLIRCVTEALLCLPGLVCRGCQPTPTEERVKSRCSP